MSEIQTTRPLRRQIQARILTVLNGPMRLILRLPISTPLSGRLMLITFTGRVWQGMGRV
ncbi:MAG: hypothetical protein M1282_19065 [Chloroflexi bacterium]|nr:hypothetical protein [Chloroflexota bacterium]